MVFLHVPVRLDERDHKKQTRVLSVAGCFFEGLWHDHRFYESLQNNSWLQKQDFVHSTVAYASRDHSELYYGLLFCNMFGCLSSTEVIYVAFHYFRNILTPNQFFLRKMLSTRYGSVGTRFLCFQRPDFLWV